MHVYGNAYAATARRAPQYQWDNEDRPDFSVHKISCRHEYIWTTLLMIVSEKGQHHMWHVIRVFSLVGIDGSRFEAEAWDVGRKSRNRLAHALNGNTQKKEK